MDKRGNRFVPLVIGPGELAAITDVETARRNPGLAVLSVALHPESDAAGAAALAAVESLSRKAERDILFQVLLSSARNINRLRQMSELFNQYASDFATKYLAQGERRGMQKGLEKGRRDALLAVVLKLLRTRPEEPSDKVLKALNDRSATGLERLIVQGDLMNTRDVAEVISRLGGVARRKARKASASTQSVRVSSGKRKRGQRSSIWSGSRRSTRPAACTSSRCCRSRT